MQRPAPTALLLVLLGVSPALAHPGHGPAGDGGSLWHYLSTPQHLAVGALLILLTIVGSRALTQLIWKWLESRMGPKHIRKH